MTNQHFVASETYFNDVLTFCVQKVQPIEAWKNIFRICSDPLVWVVFSAMTSLCVFISYYLQQFEHSRPKWDIFRITFAGLQSFLGSTSSKYKPTTHSHRIFFIFFVFGCIVYYNYIQSYWIIFMTNPLFKKQIDSVDTILSHSFELVGDEFVLHHITKRASIEHN